VLDILNGAVVHALRGERSLYKPVAEFSRVTGSSDPLQILDELSPAKVYVADLDMIMGRGNNLELIQEISRRVRTMADTGASRSSDLDRLPPFVLPVLGTETASISLIREVSGQRRIVASLDMSNRRVLSRDSALADRSPLEILEEMNHLDLDGVIIMELDRIGTSAGLDREFLKKATKISNHSLILGGGVKDEKDLGALEEIGFSGALVSTAIHNGKIQLKWIQSP